MDPEFLTIQLDDIEYWDDLKEEFVTQDGVKCTFRYTLKNLDKWESKHLKRFIDNSDNITDAEMLDFIVTMCDEDIDPNLLSINNYKEIVEYIKKTPSATVFPKEKGSARGVAQRKKVYTSEIIYAMMALNHIPFDWENRNLNKLIMLLNCVGSLQEPPKKMTKAEIMEEQRAIIMKRREEERRRRENK